MSPPRGSGKAAGGTKRKSDDGTSDINNKRKKPSGKERDIPEVQETRDLGDLGELGGPGETEEGEVTVAAGPESRTKKVDVQLDAELSAEEIQMMSMMGIPFGFASTQGAKVEDEACNAGAVKLNSKRSARQFMNRKSNGKSLPSEKTGERVGIEGYHG